MTLAAQCTPDMVTDMECTATGSTVSLIANATDPDGDTLLYSWTTTGGRITGDGANVTWDLSGAAPGTYTANVEVDDGCGCIAYSSIMVTVDRCECMPTPVPPTPTPTPPPEFTPTPPPPTPTKFDQYGNIPRNDDKGHLDNFGNELQANPGAQGYIIAYGGRCLPTGEAQRRADFAKDYLVNTRGIYAGRLVSVDGGFMEEATTELWIVSAGATPPTSSPTLSASEAQVNCPKTPGRPRSPSPTPSPGVSPTPTAEPTATPVTTGTPGTNVTPVEVKRERIELTFPKRLAEGWPGKVTLKLIKTADQNLVPVIEREGNVTRTATPLPVGTPGGPLGQAYGPDYNGFVTVSLVNNDFEIETDPEAQKPQPLSDALPPWVWTIKPKKDVEHPREFIVTIEVEWRHGSNSALNKQQKVWNDTFPVEVYKTRLSRLWALIVSTGSGLLGAGFTVPWLYDRLKEHAEGKKKAEEKKKKKSQKKS